MLTVLLAWISAHYKKSMGDLYGITFFLDVVGICFSSAILVCL